MDTLPWVRARELSRQRRDWACVSRDTRQFNFQANIATQHT